jgi:hypothetical protein
MKPTEEINTLLVKYWNGDTSLEEEDILTEYFSGNDVADELKSYTALFQYRKNLRGATLNDDFERKLKKAIRQKKRENDYITIRIFVPALRIAASVAIALALSFGVYKMIDQNNKAYFAETYSDPNAAMKHATFALDKLSEALQKGEEASIESIQELNKVDLDWEMLDSITEPDINDQKPTDSLSLENNL